MITPEDWQKLERACWNHEGGEVRVDGHLLRRLMAEVERLRPDAERFRWLCSQSDVCLHVPGQGFTDCDAATIDDSAGEDATWLAK